MKKLSREEMKNVVGGLSAGLSGNGTCCLHSATWYECGLPKADAQAGAVNGLKWCCDSCGSVIHP